MSYDVVIVSILGGGTAVGLILNQILSKRREADTRKLSRKKELTDFLDQWKGKITADHTGNLPYVYNCELPHLQTKAAPVRSDLGEMQRAKFNELIGNLSRLTTEQITRSQDKLPQGVICEPLDALMRFMDAPLRSMPGHSSGRSSK